MENTYKRRERINHEIAIVYVSQTGNTEVAAESIVDGILANYPFIEVKQMSIRDQETDLDFLQKCDAVIFGAPVYCAGVSWELKKWFDSHVGLNLSGKNRCCFCDSTIPYRRCRYCDHGYCQTHADEKNARLFRSWQNRGRVCRQNSWITKETS